MFLDCCQLRSAILALMLVFLITCVQGQSKLSEAPNVIQIKLERYGWQRLPPPVRHEAWPTVKRLMTVDSKGRTLVGYTERQSGELATRGTPERLFHILRFTPAGELDLSVSLPTNTVSNNAVFVDSQDHILAVANEMLQILTGDERTPAPKRVWKPLTSCSWDSQRCQINQTPTRRKLFVTRCLGQVQGKVCDNPAIAAYDTSSFEPVAADDCNYRFGRSGMLSDTFVYGSQWTGGANWPLYTTHRRSLCRSDFQQELPLDDIGCAVLNDDLYGVDRLGKKNKWQLGVVTAHGENKFRVELPKHDMPALSIDDVKSDAVGDRFAIVIDTLRGGVAAFDVGGHLTARRIVVYSSDSGSQLTSVSVYPPVPHYGVALGIVPGFTFDLSPDGHILAVLSGGTLIVTKIE